MNVRRAGRSSLALHRVHQPKVSLPSLPVFLLPLPCYFSRMSYIPSDRRIGRCSATTDASVERGHPTKVQQEITKFASLYGKRVDPMTICPYDRKIQETFSSA